MLQHSIFSLSKKHTVVTFVFLGVILIAISLPAEEKQSSTLIPPTVGVAKDWVRPQEEKLKKILSPLQYQVVRENGTERPFTNLYWDNKQEGIYVDIVSGEALFSSKDKFKSGTGWPSFTKPLQSRNIIEKSDKTLFMERIEVRSKQADSHLGHVFNDGPAPNGLRYCINSASLRFIPVVDLKKEGYGKYMQMFKSEK